ncbi:3-oxoacyl-ACP reductase FabG [Halopseudomonas salegens]|uniref:2,3-dihydroxy-2,3-dihydro-p-cumate dehydrogenase n=1 Tax=Halopseudomonas salegens TaxID=1434072 RepID=A0A1H2GX15_9GAMM|nr:3-oxoacyl-ACP reductase FabG [Halopseudomonas salegens]SDU24059.1 3-oxoacyl-[acyl-carrier protein] reductase [Halopseudomonas salegens]
MTDTILVTGSSRGIGRGIALRLAQDGFDVVLHCRQQRSAAEAVAEEIRALGRQARILCFDIADREAANRALLDDIEQHGPYYGIICNAGITADAAFPALSDDDWDSVIHTNLDGFYNIVKPLVMPMIQRRKAGRIVIMSSVSGIMGNRGQVNYSASKAGLIGAAKALAIELAKRKITVNCVAPGLIETDMVDEHVIGEAMKAIPMRRTGTVEEVAATVSFLCSPDAGYITRQVIAVNGGLC